MWRNNACVALVMPAMPVYTGSSCYHVLRICAVIRHTGCPASLGRTLAVESCRKRSTYHITGSLSDRHINDNTGNRLEQLITFSYRTHGWRDLGSWQKARLVSEILEQIPVRAPCTSL
jgi:hypothetical protein